MKPIVQSPVLRWVALRAFYWSGWFLEGADAATRRERRVVAVPSGTPATIVGRIAMECRVRDMPPTPPRSGWTVASYDSERDTYLLRHATLITIGGQQAWVRVTRGEFAISVVRVTAARGVA